MKKLLIALLVLVVCTALIIGCAKQAPAPATTTPAKPAATTPATPTAVAPKLGGTLTFLVDSGGSGNIGWLPETFTTVPQYWLFNSLVKDWWSGEVTGELAESWKINTSEPSITFYLRKGVTFHDGTVFDANAVKFNFNAMIDAKRRPDWKSVEVIDDYTVKLYLTSWRNTILRNIEGNSFVSPTAVQKNGKDWIKLNPVGTGPFKFVSYVADDRLVCEKYPNYWEKGLPRLDRIVNRYVPDYVTRKTAMQAKEGDMMLAEYGKQTADFIPLKDKGIEVWAQPQASSFLIFDDLNQDSPFYNQKVREAVDYAIDRQWLADNLGYGFWHPCYQLPPPTSLAYDPNYVGRKYNPDKAKQLLTEAGYPNGFKTELLPNPTALNRDIWVAVQSQLAKVGINAELKFLEAAKFQEYRNFGTWKNAIVQDALPSYGNYNTSLDQMFAPQAGFFQSMNKKRPDWVAAYEATSKTEKMDAELVKKACRVLYDNCSVVPVTEGGRGYVYQNYVKDAGIGKRGAYFWAWAWETAWLDK